MLKYRLNVIEKVLLKVKVDFMKNNYDPLDYIKVDLKGVDLFKIDCLEKIDEYIKKGYLALPEFCVREFIPGSSCSWQCDLTIRVNNTYKTYTSFGSGRTKELAKKVAATLLLEELRK